MSGNDQTDKPREQSAWAMLTPEQKQQTTKKFKTSLSYLDLGCGNASVLQMVSWGLLEYVDSFTAFGIEARKEAYMLAKRSLTFNIDDNNENEKMISLINGDFRVLESLRKENNVVDVDIDKAIDENCKQDFEKLKKCKFDLITGTPPYFRVDFNTTKGNVVTSAIINQGYV